MHEDFTAQVITIYCLCDDFLKASGYTDDPQTKMNTAEVMTVALVAAGWFGNNQEISRLFLKQHGYMKAMLSKSRFNRRLHAIPETLWQGLLWLLSQAVRQTEATKPDMTQPYIVDSCPVPVCANIRIRRCRIYQDEKFRGYCASKRCYYYGLILLWTESAPARQCHRPTRRVRPHARLGSRHQRSAPPATEPFRRGADRRRRGLHRLRL
jgi:hypothetical protein